MFGVSETESKQNKDLHGVDKQWLCFHLYSPFKEKIYRVGTDTTIWRA